MLGEFHERDLGPGLPAGERYHTSLASLRKAERRHGLEPLTRQEADSIPSQQVQARRILEERQRATQGIRERAVGEALRTVRRG
jgi:hypothetical protein